MMQSEKPSLNIALWLLLAGALALIIVNAANAVFYAFFGLGLNYAVIACCRTFAVLPVLIYAFCGMKNIRSLLFEKTNAVKILLCIAAAALLFCCMAVLSGFLGTYFTAHDISMAYDGTLDYFAHVSPAFYYFAAIIFMPFAGEVVFRGVIQRGFEKRVGAAAIVIAAIISALFSMDIITFINVTAAGLAAGFIYIKTRNLLCSVVFHCAFNIFAVTQALKAWVVELPWTLGLFKDGGWTSSAYALYNVGIAAVCALLLYACLAVIGRGKEKRVLIQYGETKSKAFIIPMLLLFAALGLAFLDNMLIMAY